jgi:hypothetical protein
MASTSTMHHHRQSMPVSRCVVMMRSKIATRTQKLQPSRAKKKVKTSKIEERVPSRKATQPDQVESKEKTRVIIIATPKSIKVYYIKVGRLMTFLGVSLYDHSVRVISVESLESFSRLTNCYFLSVLLFFSLLNTLKRSRARLT